MHILQFRATDPGDIQAAIGAMLVTVNGWSLLDFRARNDAEQVTQPWGPEVFRQHIADPEIWWTNWSQIYPHLGEIGRGLADLNIGTPDNLGILIGSPLSARALTLELVDVADLVAAGYVVDDNPQ
jgi:hypothetical protein